ncbi:hypothetical protein V8E54_012452 [Elaphomyces granulatus]|jgi:hypothetical protein
MHFLKAISVLSCAIPLAWATSFYNLSPEIIAVQDYASNLTILNSSQSVVIANGWGFTWYNSTDGSRCNGFAYTWNANLTAVSWNLNTTNSNYTAYLTDNTNTTIPQNGTQECFGPSTPTLLPSQLSIPSTALPTAPPTALPTALPTGSGS